MKKTTVLILFLAFNIFCNQNVFAKRLGGGGSYGMQRSFSKQNYRPQQNGGYSAGGQQNYNNGQNYQQRPGMGAGTAAALGAAAGAAGGYMIGRSMGNNNNGQYESGAQQAGYAPSSSWGGSNIPWGIIAILGIMLGFGLMFFKQCQIIIIQIMALVITISTPTTK